MNVCLTCGKPTDPDILYCRGLSPCFLASIQAKVSATPTEQALRERLAVMQEALVDVLQQVDPGAYGKSLASDLLAKDIHATVDPVLAMPEIQSNPTQLAVALEERDRARALAMQCAKTRAEIQEERDIARAKLEEESDSHKESLDMYRRCRESREVLQKRISELAYQGGNMASAATERSLRNSPNYKFAPECTNCDLCKKRREEKTP